MPEEPEKAKLRLVLDSNVIVSGLNFRGKPREILDLLWAGEIEVYISPFILEEVSESLKEDFGWSENAIQRMLSRLQAKSVVIQPKEETSIIQEDEADNRILDCAVQGKAQYLVTGDVHHLQPLKEYQGIKILSPRGLLQLSDLR